MSENTVGYILWPRVFYQGNVTLKDKGGKVLRSPQIETEFIISVGLFPGYTEKAILRHTTYR